MAARVLCPFEKVMVGSHCYLRLSMRLTSDEKTALVLQQLKERALGLHLRVVDGMIHYQRREPLVYTLPQDITELEDADRYMADNHTPEPGEALAAIGIGNGMVVLNTNHAAADGGYLSQLVGWMGKDVPGFQEAPPKSVFSIFEKEYAEHTSTLLRSTHDPNILHVMPNPKGKGTGMVAAKVPFVEMKAYDHNKGGLTKNTEHSWAALLCAVAAFNGEFCSGGISTMVNMRRIIDDQVPDWNKCNAVASLTPYSMNNKPEDTLEEITGRMREDLESGVAKGRIFDHGVLLKQMVEGKFKDASEPHPGLAVEMSSMGVFKNDECIDDLRITLSTAGQVSKSIVTVLSYSVMTQRTKYFSFQLVYSPDAMDGEEAERLCGYFVAALKHVDLGMQYREAVETIKRETK